MSLTPEIFPPAVFYEEHQWQLADPSNVPSLGDLLIANDLHFFSI